MTAEPVIALVDDDRNILTSVSIALQAEGFVTRVYPDGASALKALGRQSAGPWRVRHQDAGHGRPAAELLRDGGAASAMPVIFLTSKDDEQDEALASPPGADDYIAKPFSQRLLIARIRAILRRADMARARREHRRWTSPNRRRSSAAA
jgi:two-component system response regulator ChvI